MPQNSTRSLPFSFALLPLLALAFGEAPKSFSMPDWARALPESRDVIVSTFPSEADSSYVIRLPTATVVGRYQDQLRKAGVEFSTSFNGIGNTISATWGTASCVIRIAEGDDSSSVKVSCAPKLQPAAPLLEGIGRPQETSVAPASDPPSVTSAPPTSSQPPVRVNLSEAKAGHHVTYRVTGPDTYANNPDCLSCFTIETHRPADASVTIANDSGGTEQHAINLPWTKEFDAPSGRLLYLSAQKRTASRDGYGHPTKLEVTIHVDGNVIQHAETTEDYGVASVSGKVP